MSSRNRRASASPTVVFILAVSPHPFACNREAKRFYKSAGKLHTPVDMIPLRKVGEDHDGKALYSMGNKPYKPAYRGFANPKVSFK